MLVLGGSSKCCPNEGPKLRSQYLSHKMSNLGGVFPLKQGEGCANLTGWIRKAIIAQFACFMKDGESPPNDLMCPLLL